MKVKEGMEEAYQSSITYKQEEGSGPKIPEDYFKGIVDAVERVGTALDENKTPEEAIDTLKGFGITGFMAGIAIETVCHFNPRGDELRPAWNKHCGGTGKEEGVINPAIVTIGEKDPKNEDTK